MSSPWNALLESLHSALIDELNERFPDEKPSLGLPARKNGFELPANRAKLMLVSVDMAGGGKPGLAFLTSSEHGCDLEGIWSGVLRRCTTEFARRGIAPKLSTADEDAAKRRGVTRCIWIPLELHGQWHLGVGV